LKKIILHIHKRINWTQYKWFSTKSCPCSIPFCCENCNTRIIICIRINFRL